MRLTANNIKFVKEHTNNGMTYAWFVSLKEQAFSREFINYNEEGRTICAEYPKNKLPKEVQKFLEGKTAELFSTYGENEEFVTYIYR
jgi:hypothetical protein